MFIFLYVELNLRKRISLIMKNKRAIVIKGTRLRVIRNGLRNLLIKAVNDKVSKLSGERQKLKTLLHTLETLENEKKSYQETLKEYKKIQDQENELKSKLSKSILFCVRCGKNDRDMIYNKFYKAWYCNFCYCLELTFARKYFHAYPTIRYPKDNPFLSEDYVKKRFIVMSEKEIFLDSYVIENLMMYDRDIDKEDISHEFNNLPSVHQSPWILDYWFGNPEFSINLERFNEKRKEGKKRPSIYRYNNYFFRVQNLENNRIFENLYDDDDPIFKNLYDDEDPILENLYEARKKHYKTFL